VRAGLLLIAHSTEAASARSTWSSRSMNAPPGGAAADPLRLDL